MDVLTLTSPAFRDGEPIPRRHTGFGEDLSPALTLSGLCPEAQSLAIVLEDLDVPFCKTYTHWLLWNLPPRTALAEGVPPGETLPSLGGAVQGVGYGVHRYRGPHPPFFLRRPHRYVFRVCALDRMLDLPPSAGRQALRQAVSGHILQEAALMGTCRAGAAHRDR